MLQDLLTGIDELGGPDGCPIDEVLDLPEWPYASAVYVVTSSDAAEVHDWADAIEPDELSEDPADNYGWGEYADRDRSTPPPDAPDLPSGQRPVVARGTSQRSARLTIR